MAHPSFSDLPPSSIGAAPVVRQQKQENRRTEKHKKKETHSHATSAAAKF